MTAPKEWPPEAREAVAHAMRQSLYPGRILGKWEDHQRAHWGAQADAALAALAPWVAEIEAAAFKRGAEAGREQVAHWADAELCDRELADAIRLLPHELPEDTTP